MIRRRQTQVFSLAFLDCICCGFGAVILIFVLSVDSREKEKLQVLIEVNRALAEQAAALLKLRSSKEDLERSNARVATLVTDARLRNDSLHALIDELEHGLQLEKRGQEALLVDIDDLKKEIGARQKKVTHDIVLPDVPPAPVGLTIGGNYICIIIDTSGSMRDPNHGGLWPIVIRKVAEILDTYPTVKGIQLLDGDGRFIFGRNGNSSGTAAWLEDSKEMRDRITRSLRRYEQDSVSNPVPGMINAMRFLYDKANTDMRMVVYLFGDEFNSPDAADVAIRRLDDLTPRMKTAIAALSSTRSGFPRRSVINSRWATPACVSRTSCARSATCTAAASSRCRICRVCVGCGAAFRFRAVALDGEFISAGAPRSSPSWSAAQSIAGLVVFL